VRALVVDNDRLLLDSLRLLIESRWPAVQIDVASDEARALVLAATHGYELVLLDWWLGSGTSQACLDRLREVCPSARIVVMSGDDRSELVALALEHGAAGFLRKNVADFETLRQALDIVMHGGVYLPGHSPVHAGPVSPSVTGSAPKDLRDVFPTLTDRQREVLRVLLRGKSDKQIARDLDIAVTTVKTHAQALYRELGVSSRAEAVAQAARLGVRID
jgi:DNA-binding NarL/FixJ family response regulator